MRVKEFITEWTDADRAKKYNPDGKTYGKDYENYTMPQLDDPVMDKAIGFQDVDQDELMYEPDLDELPMSNALKSKIEKGIASLSPKERAVLTLRFGLGGHDEHTLADIGKRFGVQQERIRQIEARALRKLRHPSRSDPLRGHIED
jgi:RNA polymerase sigma factor (sigma-70 family)